MKGKLRRSRSSEVKLGRVPCSWLAVQGAETAAFSCGHWCVEKGLILAQNREAGPAEGLAAVGFNLDCV